MNSDLRGVSSAFALLLASAPNALAQQRVLIQNKGSDTLVNVAQAWAERYREVDPRVVVAVSGGGSGTGIAALINGTADLANASREISPQERDKARAAGLQPLEHIVGYDALGLFVHPNNPLQRLSIDQLAQIYGRGGRFRHWSELGVQVPGCRQDEIVVVSRQNNSGTYAYFKEAALKPAAARGFIPKGTFRQGTLDLHGSKDVVDLVERTPCAIAYSGLAYATPKVKSLCIAQDSDGPCVTPSVPSAIDRSYPIARPLFLYSNGAPTGPVKDYLDWIRSDAGQCLIYHLGYAPVRPVSCPQGP